MLLYLNGEKPLCLVFMWVSLCALVALLIDKSATTFPILQGFGSAVIDISRVPNYSKTGIEYYYRKGRTKN